MFIRSLHSLGWTFYVFTHSVFVYLFYNLWSFICFYVYLFYNIILIYEVSTSYVYSLTAFAGLDFLCFYSFSFCLFVLQFMEFYSFFCFVVYNNILIYEVSTSYVYSLTAFAGLDFLCFYSFLCFVVLQ
jgi:hypothetical protein